MDSALSGILNAGDKITALETCLLDTGVTRVRCEMGWASLSTSYGTVILEEREGILGECDEQGPEIAPEPEPSVAVLEQPGNHEDEGLEVNAAGGDAIEEEKWSAPDEMDEPDVAMVVSAAMACFEPVAVPVSEMLYRCVKRSQFRETSAMDSALSGILNVGDEISALESCLLDTGVTRVRCEKGWASLSTSYGTVILEDITCRDEQAAGETSTPAATSTEHVSTVAAEPEPKPLSVSLAYRGTRFAVDARCIEAQLYWTTNLTL